MKKCPFCAEEIRDDAKKCRFCAEWLESKPVIQSESKSPEILNTQESNLKANEAAAPKQKSYIVPLKIKGRQKIFRVTETVVAISEEKAIQAAIALHPRAVLSGERVEE